MATNLFAPQATQKPKDVLVEFKAGRMKKEGKLVSPETKKGLIQVKRSAEDQLIHFIWKDRETGATGIDLIIFPDEAVFRKVKESKGRVYLLDFKTSDKKLFFWMQEPRDDKDEEFCTKINDYINNPSSSHDADEDSSEGFESMNQELLQMLSSAGIPQSALSRFQGLTRSRETESPSPPTTTTTTAPASSSESSVPPTPSPSSSTGAESGKGSTDNEYQRLQQIISHYENIRPPQQQTSPNLNDVVDTNEIINSGILSNPDVQDELQSHLPESDSIASSLRSPQFRQAIDTFNAALAQGQLPELLQSFGLPPSNEASQSNLEAFLKALQQQADKKEEEEKKDDKMDQG